LREEQLGGPKGEIFNFRFPIEEGTGYMTFWLGWTTWKDLKFEISIFQRRKSGVCALGVTNPITCWERIKNPVLAWGRLFFVCGGKRWKDLRFEIEISKKESGRLRWGLLG
jgi:hypothetical protein